MHYPTGLGQTRQSLIDEMFNDFPGGFGSLGRSLGVTSSRPITGQAKVDPIEIKPVPTAGRPDDFRGAVGRFRIVTSASPLAVKVGDPVTLSLDIGGDGRLDLLRAPSLADQPDLTKDFRVDREELPGFVNNGTKSFQTTIRPRHDGVTQIPGLRLSYFDPQLEEFVTTRSDPITLDVEAAETLQLDAIVASGDANDSAPRQEQDAQVGLAPPPPLKNFSGDSLLVNQTPAPAFPIQLAAVVLLPPLVFLAGVLAVRRRKLAAIFARFVSTRRRFARDLGNADDLAQTAGAFQVFLSQRFGSADSTDDRSWSIGQIRARGEYELAIRVERFFANCEKARHTGSSEAATLEAMKAEAVALADQVTTLRPLPRKRGTNRAATHTVTMLLVMSTATLTLAGENPSAVDPSGNRISLSDTQRRVLLDEAHQLYQRGEKMETGAESEKAFAQAAEKYQLVVESGIRNAELYFNLANAQVQSSQVGRGIASYRRALRLDPNRLLYRQSLANAQDRLGSVNHDSDSPGLLRSIRGLNAWISDRVPPTIVLALAGVGWASFWAILLLRVMGIRFAWKSLSLVALAIGLLAAASYGDPLRQFTRSDRAVIATAKVVLRDGDGQSFAAVTELNGAEGTVVQVLDIRGSWMRIRLHDARSGWIAADTAEPI
jgi:tetratricopeptide (TPR) repeat protein